MINNISLKHFNLDRDVSVSDYNFLVSSGAGGLLLLLPPQGSTDLATAAVRESISTLEVRTSEMAAAILSNQPQTIVQFHFFIK